MRKLLFLLVFFTGCGKTINSVETKFVERFPISCQVYDNSSRTFTVLPDFNTLTPSGSVRLNKIEATSSTNVTVFPLFVDSSFQGITEKFGLVCSAKLIVKGTGNHTFKLTSDDGSKLSLNGVTIINHDGTHGMTAKTGVVSLTPGTYQMRVEYFNGSGDKGLILSWTKPGSVESVITDKDLE